MWLYHRIINPAAREPSGYFVVTKHFRERSTNLNLLLPCSVISAYYIVFLFECSSLTGVRFYHSMVTIQNIHLETNKLDKHKTLS